ncbi:MAG: CoA-binding protein, partial [Acidimicrobiia bacterium]|nr:CoA-binding protein [Acidimicrobiia bacterium]
MNLSRLINPRSIAVVGGTEAERVIAQCDALGFDGEIWPVNPHRSEMGGRETVASVGELASVPDAAFIAVPRKDTIAIVRTLADRGCGGVVGYASGFAEVGEVDLQHELVVAAGAMPLLGPNCYGLINATTGAALWPDEHGLERRDLGAAI